MAKIYNLELTEAELGQLYVAVIYSRDTAYVNTGDKRAPAVKSWEKLRDKITTLQGTRDD